MKKSHNPMFIYYGAFLALCFIFMGLAIAYSQTYILASVFFGLLIAGGAVRYLEKQREDEQYEALERKIKRLEAKSWYFESIVTNSKDIMFTTDLEHRIVKFNKGSEQTFGVMALEVLGKHVNTLFEKPGEIDALLEEVNQKGRARAIEVKVRNRETREEFWISVGVSKLFDKNTEGSKLIGTNTQLIGEIFTCKNVTHLRLLEQELKHKNEQLTQLSITDGLTGLYNTRHLKSEASRQQKIHNRYPDRPLSMALLDVDKFKDYNDHNGHLAGDNLLIILATIIKAQIRTDLDTAYRYGGDEFVMVFPETDEKGSRIICDRILVNFLGHKLGETSLSIGITQYRKEWGLLSVDTLVSKADEAMYQVKCKGGNGIHVYGYPLSDELAQRETVRSINGLR
jgi:diguanylate cyclase (GGDEF)-like protein/PAS domain S-box-containing protein